MDLASLAAFVAVAEHGGFSAAAEQLHLTQPAVSKRIAGLEQQLDTRLFDRLGRELERYPLADRRADVMGARVMLRERLARIEGD